MKKTIEYKNSPRMQMNDKIEKTLNAEFKLPKSVCNAKREAFEQIRDRTAPRAENRKRHWGGKIAAGMAAAAALFSGVCITNPAFAANVPLIGGIFEEIGQSLGFSGDFSQYAKPVEETEEISVLEEGTSENGENTAEAAYTKTSNGVTITLSEVYCNDAALYLSMLMESEEPFPETREHQTGTPAISLSQKGTKMPLSYNPDFVLHNAYLDGKFIDDHQYAGVLRLDLSETLYADTQVEEVPESFTAELNITDIVGILPEDQVTTPEMPQEFKDAYDQAMAEHGLDEANYENFTEEEKEIEHQLFTEMWNKYTEKYPDVYVGNNSYENWIISGNWDFTLDIKKDLSKNEVKEVNLLDENGTGVVSLTRTPFELRVDEVPNPDYFPVVVDAKGDLLPNGKFGGNANTYAIQDRDVSRVDVYVCDYTQYMDEIKGYYWSEDYEEKKKTKTFKEYLDEKALMHAEVVFEES